MNKVIIFLLFKILLLVIMTTLESCSSNTGYSSKLDNMDSDFKTISEALKSNTFQKGTFVIKKNVPSITIKKGFDFSDTYKAANIFSLVSIENYMLRDLKKPRKVSSFEFVFIDSNQIKKVKKLIMKTKFPLDPRAIEKLNINKEGLISTGYRRFLIDEEKIAPIRELEIFNTDHYYLLWPRDEKEITFDLYHIEIIPNPGEQRVYDYKGDYVNTEFQDFEFHYNQNGEFIGISELNNN